LNLLIAFSERLIIELIDEAFSKHWSGKDSLKANFCRPSIKTIQMDFYVFSLPDSLVDIR
jgi:hypothetical protein